MKKIIMLICVVLLVSCININKRMDTEEKKEQVVEKEESPTTIKISANGDLLYHMGLIKSAKTHNGYDFNENYADIKPFISKMDLAIADYEGSIHPDYQLSGYPLFNAPNSVVNAIKDAGYDVVTLANNHTLDSNLEGLFSTAKYFEDLGIKTFGYTKNKQDDGILYVNVKRINIAFVGYTYGYNGMEANVAEKDKYILHFLDEDKIKKDIEKAKQNADIVIAFPHMGDEYHLEPNQQQIDLYTNMIQWGVDIVFGNHTHVPQPSQHFLIDGKDKYIFYSMGNLISNQRIETMDDTMNKEWTERGVIIEAEIEKHKNITKVKDITFHPTWVRKTYKQDAFGFPQYLYQVLLTENYIHNQKDLSNNEYERVKTTHQKVLQHLKIEKNK